MIKGEGSALARAKRTKSENDFQRARVSLEFSLHDSIET